MQDLSVINAKLDGSRSSIQTLQLNSYRNNPGLLDDSIAFARAARVRAPTSLEAVALTRAMNKAESNKDLDA